MENPAATQGTIGVETMSQVQLNFRRESREGLWIGMADPPNLKTPRFAKTESGGFGASFPRRGFKVRDWREIYGEKSYLHSIYWRHGRDSQDNRASRDRTGSAYRQLSLGYYRSLLTGYGRSR